MRIKGDQGHETADMVVKDLIPFVGTSLAQRCFPVMAAGIIRTVTLTRRARSEAALQVSCSDMSPRVPRV